MGVFLWPSVISVHLHSGICDCGMLDKTTGPLGELLSPPGVRAGSSSVYCLPRQLL